MGTEPTYTAALARARRDYQYRQGWADAHRFGASGLAADASPAYYDGVADYFHFQAPITAGVLMTPCAKHPP